jgi:hypothetical protein
MVLARDPSALNDEVGRRLAEEGQRALLDPYGDGSEDFMPQTPLVGRCRICGETRQLTREHVPPGAAFNLGRSRLHTVDEWVQRQNDGALPGGVLKQGGLWAYTLCKPCNDLTGARYADEYRRWAGTVINMLADAGTNVRELDADIHTHRGRFSIDGNAPPRPGAFVRQVLAMMCSISAGFDLAGRYPSIRRMLLDGTTEALPAGMSIGLTAYLSTRSRLAGPMLVMDTGLGMWRWVMEVAHAPLASLLVLASNDKGPAHVCDISRFTQIAPDTRQRVEGDLEVGFGHGVLGDYRTKAGIDADPRETILVDRGASQ